METNWGKKEGIAKLGDLAKDASRAGLTLRGIEMIDCQIKELNYFYLNFKSRFVIGDQVTLNRDKGTNECNFINNL